MGVASCKCVRPIFTMESYWSAFALQRSREVFERGGEGIFDRNRRADVHGGGDHVIGTLLHVDVIVGMNGVLAAAPARGEFIGPAGDDFVGVHVGGCAGAGLENIDDELGVELAVDDFLGRLLDKLRSLFVEQTQFAVDLAQHHFTRPMAAMNRRLNRKSETGKFSTARAVCAP